MNDFFETLFSSEIAWRLLFSNAEVRKIRHQRPSIAAIASERSYHSTVTMNVDQCRQ